MIAYYTGIRMKPGEKSSYEDTGYAIFVEWKNGDHMDLIPKVSCIWEFWKKQLLFGSTTDMKNVKLL